MHIIRSGLPIKLTVVGLKTEGGFEKTVGFIKHNTHKNTTVSCFF